MAEYLLSLEQVESLFEYVEAQLDETGCDHSRRHTEQWLALNVVEDLHEAILTEMEDMGGYCDCEVLMNCYEDYEDALCDEDE